MLKSHHRYGYSSIETRKKFSWPEGKTLAVYIALNVEHFSFGEGLGAELAPGGPPPDVLNYSWRDYGNRVGIWRLLDLFNELKLPIAVLLNGAIYEHCSEVISAFRKRGDEIVAHGMTNAERQGILKASDEEKMIREVTALIHQHEGKAPKGWLGPWISESYHTPDLLQKIGYQYLLDWCCDDQPVWFHTSHGKILSIPYSQELNDIPAIAVRRASAREFSEMIVDQFEEMLLQSKKEPLVFSLALHPYIAGQPFRLHQLRKALQKIAAKRDQIWLTYPGAIAEAFINQNPM
ncbi:MAG: polysaccharide deacetylase family protein [Chlamydiota bacterium]